MLGSQSVAGPRCSATCQEQEYGWVWKHEVSSCKRLARDETCCMGKLVSFERLEDVSVADQGSVGNVETLVDSVSMSFATWQDAAVRLFVSAVEGCVEKDAAINVHCCYSCPEVKIILVSCVQMWCDGRTVLRWDDRESHLSFPMLRFM